VPTLLAVGGAASHLAACSVSEEARV
jgi:hypothetical protein